VTIGGQAVERGTLVYVPVYAVHRHRALWDDPDRFNPDRFAPELAKSRHRYAFFPFGAGPRICIGMGFAMMEAVLILATLLRAARLALREHHVPELKFRVTLRPAGGLPMTVCPREGVASRS
jgi:cytochrome P450